MRPRALGKDVLPTFKASARGAVASWGAMTKEYDTFLSFQHEDAMQMRGLRLLNANPNHKVSFRERSFIDPIKGKSDTEVWKDIKGEIDKSDVLFVGVGDKTHESGWVPREVEYARKQGIPVTAQTLPGKEDAKIPACLKENGVAVEKWNPGKLNEQLHRAVQEGKRAKQLQGSPKDGSAC